MSKLASEPAPKPRIGHARQKVELDTIADKLSIPAYLQKTYWWAYIHPRAVRIFEREWLVNLILFGNYAKLRNAALNEIGQQASGRTLQIACVYGDLTLRLRDCHASSGTLDVIDVLPIQLENLQRKLGANADSRVSLFQRDSAALGFPDGSYDQALLFFLLHEQPESVRRSTLAEAFRVVKPGGRIIIIDYHRPSKWNPLRRPLQALLRCLEPFADDLWQHQLEFYFPADIKPSSLSKETFYGGLYQKIVLTR